MKNFLITMLMFTILVSSATAQVAPPNWFQGTATTNGNPAPDNTFIYAYIGGNQVAVTTVQDGKYGFAPSFPVPCPTCSQDSTKMITFFIRDNEAGEHMWKSAESTDLNLAATGDYCGDNVCTSGESEASCPADCQTTTPPPSTGSSSGGGGGGGGGAFPLPEEVEEEAKTEAAELTSTGRDVEVSNTDSESASGCTESWECSDWTVCSNSVKNRVCIDANKCGTEENRPEENEACQAPPVEDQVSLANRITGAVTGGGAQVIVPLIILVSIIGALLAWYFIVKKK